MIIVILIINDLINRLGIPYAKRIIRFRYRFLLRPRKTWAPLVCALLPTTHQQQTSGLMLVKSFSSLLSKRQFSKYLFMRSPSPLLQHGVVSHHPAAPAVGGETLGEGGRVNYQKAFQQWKNYSQVFQQHDWNLIEIPPPNEENNLPDSVFLEDCIVAFKNPVTNENHFVITRPGHPNRINEIHNMKLHLENAINKMRGHSSPSSKTQSQIYEIVSPGTLDGGNILKINQKVYVGLNDRTNEEGIRQLAKYLTPLNYQVITVPITQVLHLKTAVTALPCGTILVYPPYLTKEELRIFSEHNDGKILIVSEEHTQVVHLSPNKVLMSNKAPKTAEILRQAPYNLSVLTVDVEEYMKLDGCVTCLSVRVR
jgi:dimethylargininase